MRRYWICLFFVFCAFVFCFKAKEEETQSRKLLGNDKGISTSIGTREALFPEETNQLQLQDSDSGIIVATYYSNYLTAYCGEEGGFETVTAICQAPSHAEWVDELGWDDCGHGMSENEYPYNIFVTGLVGQGHNGTGSGYNRKRMKVNIVLRYDVETMKHHYSVDPKEEYETVSCGTHEHDENM